MNILTSTIIRGSEKHIQSGLGAAIDYRANYEPFDIHFDGKVTKKYTGYDAGYWLWVQETTRPDRIHQFAHLSKYMVNVGDIVKVGQTVAITGGRPGDLPSAGHVTTMAHLHYQLFINGKRVRPEDYIKDYMPTPQEPIKIGKENVKLFFATFLESYSTSADNEYWANKAPNDLISQLCTSQEYKDTAQRKGVAIMGKPFSEQDINFWVAHRSPQWQITKKALERAGK